MLRPAASMLSTSCLDSLVLWTMEDWNAVDSGPYARGQFPQHHSTTTKCFSLYWSCREQWISQYDAARRICESFVFCVRDDAVSSLLGCCQVAMMMMYLKF